MSAPVRLVAALAAACAFVAAPPPGRAACNAIGAEWPVPLPAWYWAWAGWQPDRAEARPAGVPRRIPYWAWRRLAAQDGPGPEPQLPHGGRDLLPSHRVVAYFGAPQASALGALGIGSPDQAARRLDRQAGAYRRFRRVLPAFELIATVATAHPGPDGMYRFRQPDRIICRYLRAAKRAGALLILDIQPGRSSFLAEVRRLRRYLRDPHVGLALDPEWKMGPGEVPGQVIGHTDATTVNRVSAHLAGIVERHRLPEKLLLVHQFTQPMVRNRSRLVHRRGLALTINADGFGTQAAKVGKYDLLTGRRDRFFHGFKLFYEEDVGLMTPRQVVGLRPVPDVVIYE